MDRSDTTDDFVQPPPAKKKANNPRKKRKRASTTKLPTHIKTIVTYFDILQQAIIFLDKRSTPLKLETICTVVSSLLRRTFTINELCVVNNFTAKIWDVAWQPQQSADQFSKQNKLVLCIRLDETQRWRGKRHQQVRTKLFTERLHKYVSSVSTLDIPLPAPLPLPVHPNLIETEDIPTCPVEPSLVSPRNLNEILPHIQTLPFYEDQIKCLRVFPPKHAQYLPLNIPLPYALWYALDQKYHFKNMQQQQGEHDEQFPVYLYRHQILGITALMQTDQNHVVVSTGTSSGKSLIYNIPVLSDILTRGPTASTALYIFPTKALSQDQVGSLISLVHGIEEAGGASISVGTLDGDTLDGDRKKILEQASIILTNPDMLSATILPRHEEFIRLFTTLSYIVVDEAHVYRGAFGCHVACVFRRLQRICHMYGSDPVFICCSATIDNPKEHFQMLVPPSYSGSERSKDSNDSDGEKRTRDFTVLDSSFDGSPRGRREFVERNPP